MASTSSAPSWGGAASGIASAPAGSRASVYTPGGAQGLAAPILFPRVSVVTQGDPFMRFSVQITKLDKQTYYQIDTEIVQGEGAGQQLSVYRRYADFEWLQSVLQEESPGVVVPPLPESNLTDRLSTAFEDQRQAGLVIFLEKIADHPVLRQSQSLRHFLADSPDLFADTVMRAKLLSDSRKRTAKSSFFMGLKKIKGVFSKPQEGDPMHLSSKETETINYMEAVSKDLHLLSVTCGKLAAAKNSLADSLGGTAKGFKTFEVNESDQNTKRLWSEMDRATAVIAQSIQMAAFSLDRNLGEVCDFFDRTASDFVRWVKSRPEAQQLHDYSSNDLAEAIVKRQKTDSSKKLATLDEEIKKHETCVEFQKSRYEGVNENLTAEYRRYVREKLVAMSQALLVTGRNECEACDSIIEQCQAMTEALRVGNGGHHAPARASTVSASSAPSSRLPNVGSSGTTEISAAPAYMGAVVSHGDEPLAI